MRKNNVYLVQAAALICMTLLFSCTANDETEDKAVAVRFSASVDNQAEATVSGGTRAAGTSWKIGDAIGVFMVGNGGTSVVGTAANKWYTNTGSGNFTAASGHEMYYPMDESAVDFIAYYPYDAANSTLSNIDVVIGAQTDQLTFDLLYATANNNGTGYTKKYTGNVSLAFEHKLSKLVMNCEAGEGLSSTDLADMTVTIEGMYTENTFDLSAGSLGTAANTAAITPRIITKGSAYDAIIMPGSYGAGDVTVKFTVGTDIFTWTLSATEFEGGNEYTYTVTLKRTGVAVTGSIKQWTPNDEDDVLAE